MEQGMMLVISGPSGVGKGTLAKRLMEEKGFAFSVSCTTRAPRPMEVEGKDYYFITEEEFARKEKAGEFLETALVHKHHYGTPLAPAREAIVAGRDLLLDIDPQGGMLVMQKVPEAVTVFLLPPSWEELEERLRRRGTESEEQIQRRLHNAKREVDYLPHYRYVLVNDELDSAYETLAAIVTAEKHNTVRYRPEFLKR